MYAMNEQRKQELKRSLEDALNAESALQRFTPRDKVVWLAQGLEEYIERWLAFCRASPAPMSSLLETDLYGAIEIGTQCLGDHLAASEPSQSVREAWISFCTALRTTQSAEKQELAGISDAFNPFNAKLASDA